MLEAHALKDLKSLEFRRGSSYLNSLNSIKGFIGNINGIFIFGASTEDIFQNICLIFENSGPVKRL